MRTVVVGSLNQDVVVRVPRLPGPGETLLGRDLLHAAGGKGQNQAVAAARAGADVAMIGLLGDDAAGVEMRTLLVAEGIDVTGIGRVAGPSGTALIWVSDDGENSIVVVPGANGRVDSGWVERQAEVFRGAGVVLAQLEVADDAVAAGFRSARAAGATTVLNVSPAHDVRALLPLIDVLVVNESEAALLSGLGVRDRDTARRAAAAMGEWVKGVVVTLGSDGVLVVDGNAPPVHIPAFEVTPVDTTGAGDAFAGVLASRLAQREPLAHAAVWGAAAGAIATTVVGAVPSLPRLDDITRLVRSRS
jgi:ribokinase